jgi:hypothetical protein
MPALALALPQTYKVLLPSGSPDAGTQPGLQKRYCPTIHIANG